MVNNMTYKTKFIIDGITYFENSINGKVSYTKIENNHEVPVSHQELSYFQNNFSSYLSFFIADYYLSKNNNIDLLEKRLIRPILSKVEEIIPTSYRTDFYKNLKTLKVVFEEESNKSKAHFKAKETKTKGHVVALYDSHNTLLVNKTYFQKTILKSDNKSAVTIFKSTIFHELQHMSSTKYDFSRKAMGFGFYSIYDNGKFEYIGLTEGYTQLITSIFYPNEIMETNYSIPSLLMYQLMQIVGKNILDSAYYDEHSLTGVINKLCEYIPDYSLAKYLLDTIEEVYYSCFNDKKNNYLHEVQSIMKHYLKAKIDKSLAEGMNEDKIITKVEKFRKSLITEEKLRYLNINPKKYLNIANTLEDFTKYMSYVENSNSLKR